MSTWDGEEYQRGFDALAASGQDVHGEADFVMALEPASVLDAGCGTGRVAIELARRGVEVVGADVDVSMIAAARKRAPHIEWVQSDLAALGLGRTFDVVVLAGNVPLFTPPGTEAALVAGCARHVGQGGAMVAGFSLDRSYDLATYDAHVAAAGLTQSERYATWDRVPFDGGDYAVSVHRRAAIASPAAQVAHDRAEQQGAAGYLDPVTGLFVLTATYLLTRGDCCSNGCRHCPY